MKKLMLCGLLMTTGSLFASNYVEKITGLGPDAQHETVYDPMMAEMMRSMNRSEDEAHVRQAAKQGRIITKKQARAEINSMQNRFVEASAKYAQEQQLKDEKAKVEQRAKDSKKAFSGMKKGFL